MEFFAVFIVIVILGLLGIFFFGSARENAEKWKKSKVQSNETFIDFSTVKADRIPVVFENMDDGRSYTIYAAETGENAGRNELGGKDRCISRNHLTLLMRHGQVIALVNKQECPVFLQSAEDDTWREMTECFTMKDGMVLEMGESRFQIHLNEGRNKTQRKKEEKTKLYIKKGA